MKGSLLFPLAWFCCALPAAGGLSIAKLRCEYLDQPLGIDARQPRLSWIVESAERGQKQSAYQVLVASGESKLASGEGDLWDSGKVASGATAQIEYAGKALASSQRCFWKVRAWDKDGQVSAWSAPARWEMGLLTPADWKAKWIARTTETAYQPAPRFRREFELKEKPCRATAYVCGLGCFEMRLNGDKVGDHLLDPGYTRFDKRALYVTQDVTDRLQAGKNALGVTLGTGWFNVHTKAVWNFHEAPWRAAPKLILQLRLEYADGRVEEIGSDDTWRTATGPVVFDSIYGGETYDARLEQAGWDAAGYSDTGWQAAKVVAGPPGCLSAQAMPPIRLDRLVKPVKCSEPKPGVFVLDFGLNMAGCAELRLAAPAGTRVEMKYGERLNPDGTLDTKDIGQHVRKLDPAQQYQTDTYIAKGAGEEKWHSQFTYHGFQYVEMTGFPGRPTLDSLTGRFFHSDVPKAGVFECSNPLLNKIQQAALQAFLSNLQSIPTDCPHREKNGWTGDAHLAAEQAQFNFLPVTAHSKWLNDLGDEQQSDGRLPGIVPTSGWGYTWGNGPAWDSAFVLIPYYEYLYYGDTENLRRHYAGLKRYVDYLGTRAQDGILKIGLNDWAPWKTKTDAAITDTAYWYVDTKIVALAAGLLGKKDEAAQYAKLAENIRTAFNRKFYHPDTGSYDNGSQTALSCAIYQGLVEPANKARVLENLVAAVEKADNHIDTGILGAKYLLNALLENGRADVAYRMVAQKDQPSWGWWIEQGATTLWEQWNGTESRNHIMFGDVSAWFYKALAGINPDAAAPGFSHFEINPHALGDLTSARAEYDSIRGMIRSEWKVDGNTFQLKVTIPANATATVRVPAKDVNSVTESGKPAVEAAGLKFVRMEAGRAVFEAGSGDYEFIASGR